MTLALPVLFAVNGAGFLGVLRLALGYLLVHLVLCAAASAAAGAALLRRSPMRLLQVKE